MSITDELRQYAYGYEMVNHRLLGIADRIDEAHERAIADAELCTAPTEGQMEEMGYVALPVDADGVPIRIGDVMEGIDKYDTLKKVKGKVITVSFESDGTADVAIQAWNSDGKSWHRTYLDSGASVYRHHHAPTVEDVLDEFASAYDRIGGEDDEHQKYLNLVSEYAKKLRLAGETE